MKNVVCILTGGSLALASLALASLALASLALASLTLMPVAGSAAAAEKPEWAFPVTEKDQPPPRIEGTRLRPAPPGSTLSITRAKADDMYDIPNWYPDMYPALPKIVQNTRHICVEGWDVVGTVDKGIVQPFRADADRRNYSVGLSQVLTRNTLLGLNLETDDSEGYLHSPYRSVRFIDPTVARGYSYEPERYPGTRTSNAANSSKSCA